MAKRAYIIPLRSDLAGMKIQINDLLPNTSQRNSSLDGQGQTTYLKYSLDVPGTTTVTDDTYVSGSKTTQPISSLTVTDSDEDATDDSSVTSAANFGLIAYLRDRIQAAPGGAADVLTATEARDIFRGIVQAVGNGESLTLADINTIIDGVSTGAELNADGGTDSFGSVEDVMRILSGEVYRVRENTILADESNVFLAEDDRQTLVDAATGTYYAKGEFLTEDEAGYNRLPVLALTGAVRASAREGQLSKWGGYNEFSFTNPNFAYSASTTTSVRPRAYFVDGGETDPFVVLGTNGTSLVLKVYDSDGNIIE